MKLLLIEDDPQKAERVTLFLNTLEMNISLDTCRSYQSGLKYLENHSAIDFIILDMSLPTFDPSPNVRLGRPRPLGGYDLMRKLKRLKIRSSIIVLTAYDNFDLQHEQFTFEELKDKLKAEFEGQFLDAIYYSQSRSGWQDQLLISLCGGPE